MYRVAEGESGESAMKGHVDEYWLISIWPGCVCCTDLSCSLRVR